MATAYHRLGSQQGVCQQYQTCPHYLALTAEEVPDGATEFKCAPPIRAASNRERIWEGLRDGTIDIIVSDHSPCPAEMKYRVTGDFFAAWGGIASLQLSLSVVWTEASSRGFGPADIARWMCSGPSKLAGLAGRKGAIVSGFDADFVFWDPDEEFMVQPEILHHRHNLTPYAGRRLRGVVKRTYVRGRHILLSGNPQGRILTRARNIAF
jgi:allantoinase